MALTALQTARTICEGEEKKQYVVLRDYGGHLLKINHRSTVYIQSRGVNNVSERMYVCLKACKDGFKAGCRPLIGLDGCFLKGYFGGLVTVSQNGNNSFYVIAYALGGKAYRPAPVRALFGAPLSRETVKGASAATAKRFASVLGSSSGLSKKNQ